MNRLHSTALLAFALGCAVATAHPLGNFSMNQYTLVDLRGAKPVLHWQVDIAETPSFREMDLLDQDMDEKISDEEIAAYLDQRAKLWFEGLSLTQEGEPVELTLLSRRLRILEGSEAQPVFQIELTCVPTQWEWAPAGEASLLVYRSDNLINARGYREAKILMDKRFPIGLGPWEEGEYKYQQTVATDEQDNPIFQSFYNVYRLELGAATGEAKEIPIEASFDWSATAQSEDRPSVIMTFHEDTYAPGEITFLPTPAVEEEPEQPAVEAPAEPAPEPLSGPLSVAHPSKGTGYTDNVAKPEPQPTEGTARSLTVATVALMLVVAMAFIAIVRVLSRKRDEK